MYDDDVKEDQLSSMTRRNQELEHQLSVLQAQTRQQEEQLRLVQRHPYSQPVQSQTLLQVAMPAWV